MNLLIALASGAAIYVLAVVILNRRANPRRRNIAFEPHAGLAEASHTLTVLSWNLGYAGLGNGFDFVYDGGTRRRATRDEIRQNFEGIIRTLDTLSADVKVVQEVTTRSPMNRNLPMWDQITQRSPQRQAIFAPDFVSDLIPSPFRLEHGMGILAALRTTGAETIPLEQEAGAWIGFLRKSYISLVTRHPIAGTGQEWVIANVHLAAYDEDGGIRVSQVRQLLDFGVSEHARGNHVIFAGDWNMLLCGYERDHGTDVKNLGWVRNFPSEILPDGWRVVCDPRTPTVRQLDAPYTPGRNYLAIIDGFLISPGLEVTSVTTIDQRFAYSDHHPVCMTVSGRTTPL